MAKFKFSVATKYIKSEVTDEIEIDDDELEGMTEIEIKQYVRENYFNEWLWNNIYTSMSRIG